MLTSRIAIIPVILQNGKEVPCPKDIFSNIEAQIGSMMPNANFGNGDGSAAIAKAAVSVSNNK